MAKESRNCPVAVKFTSAEYNDLCMRAGNQNLSMFIRQALFVDKCAEAETKAIIETGFEKMGDCLKSLQEVCIRANESNKKQYDESQVEINNLGQAIKGIASVHSKNIDSLAKEVAKLRSALQECKITEYCAFREIYNEPMNLDRKKLENKSGFR